MLAIAYNNIANIYKTEGQHELAIQYFDKSLDMTIQAYGSNDLRAAKIYNGKGNVFLNKGQYDLALGFFQKSLNINKANYGAMHISVAKDLNDIGIIYNKNEEYDKALIKFKDAYDIQIDVLGEHHPDIAGTCNNIGFILEFQNKHESSLKFYLKAVEIKKANFGDNHPELAIYYNNIGINYFNRKDYRQALEYYLKAVSILENNYGHKFPGLVRMYLNVADLYRKQKIYDKSLQYYQKSITANVLDFNPEPDDNLVNPKIENYLDINKLLNSLSGKAGVLEVIYLQDSLISILEHSLKTYVLCDSVISIARKKAFKESDKIEVGNETRKINENMITVLYQLSKKTDNKNKKESYIENMFYYAEKNKTSILSQAVTSSSVKKFADIPESILEEEKALKQLISSLEKNLAESSDDKVAASLKDILFDLNEDLRKLNIKIEKEYPKYFNSKYKDIVINLKDIQSKLKNNEAVRSYFSGDEVFIIFTITKDGIKQTSIDKPAGFEQKVKEFNKYITSGYQADFSNYLTLANEFYNLFFPDKLPEDINKLTIIPDGLISMIPFEALITETYTGDISNYKEYPFLIKKYQINYAYSAGLLIKSLNNKKNRNNTKDWLGIAPVFENVTAMKINNIKVTSLPGSKKEIHDIENLFNEKGRATYSAIGKPATETYLKNENLSDYKYIHIATHGIVDPEEPKLSGILLYPKDAENDGILFSGEIYDLELNADLIVLSACETGLGKVSKSEGIIGLSRALMYAGSDNTIVSLWKVSDVSTNNLMVDFYKNLLEDEEDKAKALHSAKLKMIEKGESFAHPFFWSPFVLIGK